LMTKFCKCHELPLYLQLLFLYDSASSSCNQMAGKQAKVLSQNQIDHLLAWCLTTREPIRNRALVLLSVKAGLRAGEIANLTWDMVIGPTGAVEPVLDLQDVAAKNGSGRRIPLHP